MNKTEKQVIKKIYTEKLETLKLFKGDEHATVLEIELKTIEALAKELLKPKEVIQMKNEANIQVYYNNSKYLTEIVENIFSWMNTIKKQTGENIYPFVISNKGVSRLNNHYDWLDKNEYKGFFSSLELLNNHMNEKSVD